MTSATDCTEFSVETISRWMRKPPRYPESVKRRLAFLRNHRESIAAMDFFTVPTNPTSSRHVLAEAYPAGDGGYAVVVDEKQHVPTGWRDVGVLRDLGGDHAVGKARDVEIDEALAAIERVRGHAGPKETDPANVGGLRRFDLDGLTVSALGRRAANHRSRSPEE